MDFELGLIVNPIIQRQKLKVGVWVGFLAL